MSANDDRRLNLREVLAAAEALSAGWAETVAGVEAAWDVAHGALGALKAACETQAFADAMTGIAAVGQAFVDSVDANDRFGAAMLCAQWPPTRRLDVKSMNELVEVVRAGPSDKARREIDGIMVSRFKEVQLRELLGIWRHQPFLARRMPVLEAVVDGHLSGAYFLTVPTMLAQMEGAIADGYGHKGWLNETTYEQYINGLLAQEGWLWFGMDAVRFLSDHVLVNFLHGDQVASVVSRHAILHGASVDYGYKEASLKLILAFDLIQDSFRLVATENGRTYHLPGCAALRRGPGAAARRARRRPARRVFQGIPDAIEAGLRPCTRCLG